MMMAAFSRLRLTEMLTARKNATRTTLRRQAD
jgi:hypothetical protein